jgi:pimeloyl-ACP methyl ester carboxylesterase
MKVKAVYPEAEVEIVDLGHCPHDENPKLFNSRVKEWMSKVTAGEKSTVAV